jgi:hypothetical protein
MHVADGGSHLTPSRISRGLAWERLNLASGRAGLLGVAQTEHQPETRTVANRAVLFSAIIGWNPLARLANGSCRNRHIPWSRTQAWKLPKVPIGVVGKDKGLKVG